MFVLTGVLESMERDETKSLIERYGGKVTGNISKKTTYLIQGRDSGVSKLEKVKNISECDWIANNNLKMRVYIKKWNELKCWPGSCTVFLCALDYMHRRRVWAQRSWMRMVCWS